MSTRDSKQAIKDQLKRNQEVARDKIDGLLNERGWSKRVLSERSGVAEATIYNFYSGANKLGLLVLQSIAKAFEVSEWYLLGLTDDPKDFLDPNLTITNAGEHAVNDEKNAAEQKIRAIVALLSVEEAKEAASLLERLYTGRTAPGHARPARPRN